MYTLEIEERDFGAQADELPGALPDLQERPPLVPRPAAAHERGRASATATSRAARCTASCASATSRRTTRTSSAPWSRSRRRSRARSTSPCRSTSCSAWSTGWSCRRGPRTGWATTRCGIAPRHALAAVLDHRGLPYAINEGDGAFYGPKIDVHLTDSIGRSWQCGTFQLDFNLPERFDLTYTGADDHEHRPVMIHRAMLGSFERFIGILIEHYAGEFPLWLAPTQAVVLPIADRHHQYAEQVVARLEDAGLRARADLRGGVDRQEDRRGRDAQGPRRCWWSATASGRPRTVAVRRHGRRRPRVARRSTRSWARCGRRCDERRPPPEQLSCARDAACYPDGASRDGRPSLTCRLSGCRFNAGCPRRGPGGPRVVASGGYPMRAIALATARRTCHLYMEPTP